MSGLHRGYKGGRKSSDINSRPATDAYRRGWDATFALPPKPSTEKPKQKDPHG